MCIIHLKIDQQMKKDILQCQNQFQYCYQKDINMKEIWIKEIPDKEESTQDDI